MGEPARTDAERMTECVALAELAEARVERMRGGLVRALNPEAWDALARRLATPTPEGPDGRDPVDSTLMRYTAPKG